MIETIETIYGELNNPTEYIKPLTQEKIISPTTSEQVVVPDEDYNGLSKVIVDKVTNKIDDNIVPSNIKKDVSILGVAGNIVELEGEERTITPTKEVQVIEPSIGKNAITKAKINAIPDEYIIPTGTLDIYSNGSYDVTYKAKTNVNIQPKLQEKEKTIVENGINILEPDETYDGLSKVTINVNTPIPSGTLEITSNGNYNVKEKELANVNVPEKQLGTKTVTNNGTYKAIDDNLDGYSEVNVETSGVDINEYFTSAQSGNGGTSLQSAIKKVPSNLDISKITSLSSFLGLVII